MTDEKGVTFEDGSATLNTDYQRFSIENNKEQFYRLKINFLKNVKIDFKKEIERKRVKLIANFDSLNLNIVQNFLDYTKEDGTKKSHEEYTYELYNKDKVKKVVITYQNFGEWFDIEIL